MQQYYNNNLNYPTSSLVALYIIHGRKMKTIPPRERERERARTITITYQNLTLPQTSSLDVASLQRNLHRNLRNKTFITQRNKKLLSQSTSRPRR